MVVECDYDDAKHLQGICRDGDGNLFWSFTDVLVKTDASFAFEKRYECDVSLSIAGLAAGKFLVAEEPRT